MPLFPMSILKIGIGFLKKGEGEGGISRGLKKERGRGKYICIFMRLRFFYCCPRSSTSSIFDYVEKAVDFWGWIVLELRR